MTILGFSGSLTERESNLDRIVRAILEGSGKETELVKLSRQNYSGCRGCAARCAGKELCPLDDDLKPYFSKIKEAEALVVGTTVYFGGMNSLCSLGRWLVGSGRPRGPWAAWNDIQACTP